MTLDEEQMSEDLIGGTGEGVYTPSEGLCPNPSCKKPLKNGICDNLLCPYFNDKNSIDYALKQQAEATESLSVNVSEEDKLARANELNPDFEEELVEAKPAADTEAPQPIKKESHPEQDELLEVEDEFFNLPPKS